MIKRLQKYEKQVVEAKGHQYLYGRFEKLVDDLKGMDYWSGELSNVTQGIINQLLYESAVTAHTPFYPLYSLRCWTCAGILHRVLKELDSRVRNDSLLTEIETVLIERGVMIYMDEDRWDGYIHTLVIQSRWHHVRWLIDQCITASDEGRRPRSMEREKELHRQLKRAVVLMRIYATQTHDLQSVRKCRDKLDINHFQSILYNLVRNSGDTRIMTLIIDSISLIEQIGALCP